jgi:hypothetical protein
LIDDGGFADTVRTGNLALRIGLMIEENVLKSIAMIKAPIGWV